MALTIDEMIVKARAAVVARFRDVLFMETGKPNPVLVGKDAPVIAKEQALISRLIPRLSLSRLRQ